VIRLAVRVRRAQAELVLADLLELARGGVEETEIEGDVVEYAVYGPPGELPELPDLRAVAGEALVEVSSSEVADDWGERWKRFHRPVLVESPAPGRVKALHVRPPGAAPHGSGGSGDSGGPDGSSDHDDPEGSSDPRDGDVEEIVIDPGQAFGTGGHATTRLCLELLLRLTALRGGGCGPLLDVGTGSGVLAIAAARLGYGPVLALDHDRLSVTAATENAHVNGVAIEVRRFDLRRAPLPDVAGAPAPAIVANLLKPLLLDLVSSLETPPEHLIASGLLCEEVEEVADAFAARLGLRERERRESGEWAAVWLTTVGDD
jgi:ribosomal protein L11 methyltransferase